MTYLAHIADRALNRPLLITPDKAQVVMQVLAGRIGIDGPSASRFFGDDIERDEDGKPVVATNEYGFPVVKRKPYNVAEGVAIITITGSLVNRGAWIGASSGLTSYEGIQHQLFTAAKDTDVHAVILDIASPGGEAVGAMETAAAVRELAKAKPVVAVVNGMAASGGYAIASGATEIVTTETGVSGSIGVVLLHADFSRNLANEGISPTLIFAGAHKVDGNPFEPLSDAVRDDLQAEVNGFYEAFLKTVSAGRGRRLTVDGARRTEARTFVGEAAVAAGVADRVGTFGEVMAQLTKTAGGMRPATPATRRNTMDTTTPAPSAAITTGDLEHARNQGVAEGRQAAQAENQAAIDQAVLAERGRVGAILTAAGGAHEATARHLIAAGASAEMAEGVFASLPKQTSDPLAAIRGADRDAEGATAAPVMPVGGGASAGTASTPEGWRAEYAASKALQAEFVDADDYVAFKKRG
ncbi:putative phage head-tail preconnector protein [Stappia sp. 22II-S9-Z10]|nr:putative phage head-tail preconnector protein [Stappia sp. 22II-S9-Z10]